MLKLGGTLLLITLGGAAFLGILNQARSTVGKPAEPAVRNIEQTVDRLPDAASQGAKETVNTITDSKPGREITEAADPTATVETARSDVTSRLGTIKSVLGIIWAALKVLAWVALLLLTVALVTRTISRRRRRYINYEIRTHRESVVSTEQIQTFMAATSNLIYVRSRRLQRLFFGSPSFAFRVLTMPNRKRADSEVASYITIPADETLNRLIRNKFADTYQDAELKRIPPGHWPRIGREIVRNKKTRPVPYTIRVPGISTASESFDEGFNAPVMDTVVTTMASHPIPAELQIVATPVPRPYERIIYLLGRVRHGSDRRADAIERLEGENTAKASASEAHLFVEMRVGAPSYPFARDIAAVLQGAAGGDAQLRERRPVIRKHLYQARFHQALGNPIPGWRRCVYSTSELASLWQLPSAQLRAITTKRINRRKVAVPPEVHYVDGQQDGEAMWLSPEKREIALLPEDFLFGVGVAGQQGMGKTVLMARMVSALLTRSPDFAGLLCDPKGDLAEAALAFLPADRTVRYIDFDDPQIGINPFRITDMRDEAAIVNVVLHGIIDVARTEEDESQILASSKDFLTMALYATLATTVPFGIEPTFYHLRKWISSDPRNVEWRKRLLTMVIAARPSREFIVDGYEEYHSSLERSEAQFTSRAAAPMNKVAELLVEGVDRVLRHDLALNFEAAIENREVIIVNGRNHKSADLIFRLLWQMADQTLGRLEAARNRALQDRQQGEKVTVPDAVKFLFAVDEAPSIVTPTTAEIMARRRSAGLHMMLGWQHDAQIRNPAVRSSLYALLHNMFQFRTAVDDARQRVDLFQMTYDDQQDSRLREIRTNRVSVADLTYLDRYNFYAFQLVNGNRVPAYWGWTVNPAGQADHRRQHLAIQAKEGGHSMGPLSPPDFQAEAAYAINRMSFDPPEFGDPQENRVAAIGDPGLDFDAALKVNDVPTATDPAAAVPVTTPAKNPVTSPATGDRTPTIQQDATPKKPAGQADSIPAPTRPAEPAALDESLPVSRDEILADLNTVTGPIAGPGETGPAQTNRNVEVGPLGPHLPGEIGPWLEAVDVLRDTRTDGSIEFIEPPDNAVPGSIAARNEKARKLAADSKLVPGDIQVALHWLYEFNVASTTQLVYATHLSRPTLGRRLNTLLAEGMIRGIQLGKQKIWTLTDLGTRTGRGISNRYGPLIPHEPGKGSDGKHEAPRQWGPRNVTNAHAIIHDLHLASWVMAMVELLDGDFRYTENAGRGIVQKITGEFGSLVDPPAKKSRRRQKEPVDLFSLPEMLDGLAFRGIDTTNGEIPKVHPDASIRLHNLTAQPETARREMWVEFDRQGHTGRLEEKLRGYDIFQGLWWRTVPRFKAAGRPPVVIFVAPNAKILKRQLAVADRVLTVQAGRRREGPERWGAPPARQRIFFALESDLHKGSTRMYRVPELPPQARVKVASNERERTEAGLCCPRLEERLLPARLMAGRRDGTNTPGWVRGTPVGPL